MQIGQFWRFKKLYAILNYVIVLSERFFLTINFACLKFVRNLIIQSGSDSHKAHKQIPRIYF